MRSQMTSSAPAENSAARSWLRALELTASIPRNRYRLISDVVEEVADERPDVPALLSERECFTYRELVQRSRQYARWALEQQLAKGGVVGLLMGNRPEFFALWLGITSIGGVVALLNTNLTGPALAHCIDVASPQHLIVEDEYLHALGCALPALKARPVVWVHGSRDENFAEIEEEIRRQDFSALSAGERPTVSIEDRALYIYTSGTTGLPKAANVSHARALQWSCWFAGMMGIRADDRVYSCLPMYHSIGGVLVPGAALAGGGSLVVRERFSASRFWDDIERWDCTIFQYIGEFCRYLLHVPPSESEQNHRIRLACGNGMSAEVWEKFSKRFRIARVLEFYASTEGGVSLFNAEGRPGAIGRIPPYLAHRFSPALVRFDADAGEPLRNEQGFCIPCAVNEPGEALGRMAKDPSSIGTRFEGYTDSHASDSKILRDVFKPGDAWVRTGDLMRRDEMGFFYFVDRVGDTFRWKGENVATTEVAEAICGFPGIRHANVYGVKIPGTEGRAGMAAIVAAPDLDLDTLWDYLAERLPTYARPLFLRMQDEIGVTGTFKYSKTEMVRQGFDPTASADPVYMYDPQCRRFRPLDKALYDQIQAGEIRL